MKNIKVEFVDKENLEEVIKNIGDKNIKWITQNGEQYTVIYEEYKKESIQVWDKSVLGI